MINNFKKPSLPRLKKPYKPNKLVVYQGAKVFEKLIYPKKKPRKKQKHISFLSNVCPENYYN